MNEWVKAWRPRPGSAFEARVSPLAKDWFRGLLVHLSDDGEMFLPRAKTAAAALGMALGYPKGQRRTIAPLMAECLEHGCLVAEQDDDGLWTIWAPAWATFQSPKRGDKRKPPVAPPTEVTPRSSTSPRTRQVPTASPESKTGTHRGTRKSPKQPESLNSDSAEKRREEEKREEEEARGREGGVVRDPWEIPLHHSGVWRIFESACVEAELPWPGMCGGVRAEDCRKMFELFGGEALVGDMQAWATEIGRRDTKPERPWLSYSDHVGNWEQRAKRATERKSKRASGRGPVPARTEADFADAEDVMEQLDRQLGARAAE